MRGLTVGRIASVCGGRLTAGNANIDAEISFITTDSREASVGCLFAALRGQNHDGHDFIDAAFVQGAVCCISERLIESHGGAVIKVDSTMAALGKMAAYYRSQFDIPFIGITGSVGKTTAKEMLGHVFSERFDTLSNEGNLNNELGVPMTLFRLDGAHELAVLEMGVSDFGEMSRLTAMVRPDIAVFTVIGDAHLEFFKSRRGVMRAKAEITEGMSENGVVIINGDDELQNAWDFGKTVVRYGLGAHCDVRAENITELGLDGSVFDIVGNGRRFSATVPSYGKHMVSAALAAAAAGMLLGLSDAEISAGIAKYTPEGSRAVVRRLTRCTIIDDCYNANPTSTSAALESLSALYGRRVCILGDMRELGASSRELHTEIGLLAASLGIDLIIACGVEAEAVYRGAAGYGANAVYYQQKAKLIAELPQLITKGDTVLVKASRGMQFEDVVRAITESDE